MRSALVVFAVAAGCSVTLTDLAGRACDDLHPCQQGRVCNAGTCVAPSALPAGEGGVENDGGGCGDAGACPPGATCDRGTCVTCSYVASPGGADSAPGTADAPFQTLARLAEALGPGVVGCLRSGSYSADVFLSRGGVSNAPAVVRSFPGERAKLTGRLIVGKDASFVTLAQLDIDGTNGIGDSSPVILAPDVTIEDCDLTSTAKDGCLRLGEPVEGDASRALVRRNRIHDCGTESTNSASGVKIARGTQIQIVDNAIYDNEDQGVLLYPLAQDSLVAGNVIDGNRFNVVFGGTDNETANGNVVERNLLTFPVASDNVTSFYSGSAVGQGNIVRKNCLFGGEGGGGIPASPVGFTASDNTIADPRYIDRATKDFRLRADSACAVVVGGP